METFLQNRFQTKSTRSLSEMLILSILLRLGKAKLSEIHQTLRNVTADTSTLFFTGQPLKKVLDGFRDLRLIQATQESSEPQYEIVASIKPQVREFEGKLNPLFPRLANVRPFGPQA
jgi:hypothetical protein